MWFRFSDIIFIISQATLCGNPISYVFHVITHCLHDPMQNACDYFHQDIAFSPSDMGCCALNYYADSFK